MNENINLEWLHFNHGSNYDFSKVRGDRIEYKTEVTKI